MKIRFKKYPRATHSTSVSLLYNKALRLYIFVYMLDIACQTAGPNWLKFSEGTLENPWLKQIRNCSFFKN